MEPLLKVVDEGQLMLAGPLVLTTAGRLYRASKPEFPGDSEVVIDLEKVERVDSAGLALLVQWARLARQRNCRLRYRSLPPQVDTLVRVYGMETVLNVAH